MTPKHKYVSQSFARCYGILQVNMLLLDSPSSQIYWSEYPKSGVEINVVYLLVEKINYSRIE